MSVASFISDIAVITQEVCRYRDHWVLPSVEIAQGALESGWGTSSSYINHNAIFGIKASDSYIAAGGLYYTSKTTEQRSDGSSYVITASFRAYASLRDSIVDYQNLITGASRYAAAVNNTDKTATITAIKAGGYATDVNYVTKVLSMYNSASIRGYDLTLYDVGMGGGTVSGGGTGTGTGGETGGETGGDTSGEQNSTALKVGDNVTLQSFDTLHGKKYGTNSYGGKFRNYYTNYKIVDIEGDYAYINNNGGNTSKVLLKYLERS